MLYYCKKCGRLVIRREWKGKPICDCCESEVFPVPSDFLVSEKVPIIKSDIKEEFIDKYIKPSPEFNQYLFDHREEILANKHMAFQAHINAGKAILEEKSRVPKCPSCGSSNVSKISTLNRVVSTGIFGLASSKIGKTHKCNNCGTTW